MQSFSFLLVPLLATVVAGDTVAAGGVTSSNEYLQTWWHDSGEVNYQTAVQDENVRQSHLYSAWVKSTSDENET